jgi:hypothetical protein
MSTKILNLAKAAGQQQKYICMRMTQGRVELDELKSRLITCGGYPKCKTRRFRPWLEAKS